MSDKLNVFHKAAFDENIIKEQEHTYYTQTQSFGYNDEIEIIINQQDILIEFSTGYLYLECALKPKDEGDPPKGKCTLTNNAGAYLFETITYELNGKEIDKVRDPGTVSTIRALLCYSPHESVSLGGAGWIPTLDNAGISTYNAADKTFSLRIPLGHLFSVFHDYRKIIMGKHKFRLVRARNDNNCYKSSGTSTASIDIQKIELKVKHIQPSDAYKLNLLERINSNKSIQIPFRQWEFHELPTLKTASKDIWSVKTTSNLTRPRFVCVCFQTGRKDNRLRDISHFDNINITNIRLWLNSEVYPFENQHFDFTKNKYTEAFQLYTDFQKLFYGRNISFPMFNYATFVKYPIFVIDSSRQEDTKLSTVDVKLEFESSSNFPDDTRCYCIIINDKIIEYNPLTTLVRELI